MPYPHTPHDGIPSSRRVTHASSKNYELPLDWPQKPDSLSEAEWADVRDNGLHVCSLYRPWAPPIQQAPAEEDEWGAQLPVWQGLGTRLLSEGGGEGERKCYCRENQLSWQ